METFALYVVIAIALAFDFVNGFHDAANSIATVVSTRVLSPRLAVVWAAFFNFIAFAVFGLHVAQTVGTGIVHAQVIDAQVIFAALIGAIAWNVITWVLGIPSSSSHALIGGLLGARLAFTSADERWQFVVNGTNLTDKRTLDLVFDHSVFASSYVAQQNPLRSVSATLRYGFR